MTPAAMTPAMGGDTIFAPATGAGRAGVAMVRLSGPAARGALERLTGAPVPPPRHASRARFSDPASGEALDDGLCLWFPAPASFTGEDVAELHVHGGRATIKAVMDALAREPGLRLAEPGEFSRRAFENGKLDLTAIEGLADLVAAETDAQRRQALRQLDGGLGRLYDDWRGRLVRALSRLEAQIDFPEDDLPDHNETGMNNDIKGLVDEITLHLDDKRRGERLRDGVYIAILGPPNVGKSSLLNVLAQREAAIVSALAGTTRDVVEVHLDLGGFPVIVADTAGLREAGDDVERAGVERALARAGEADLKILVFDAAVPEAVSPDAGTPGTSGTFGTWGLIDENTLVVYNKIDLVGKAAGSAGPRPALGGREPAGREPGDREVCEISVRTGAGLEAFLAKVTARVRERVEDGGGGHGSAPLTRARHRAALVDCRSALRRALDGGAVELVAEDMRLAAGCLGRITGRVDVEDILDVVFRDFCIGK